MELVSIEGSFEGIVTGEAASKIIQVIGSNVHQHQVVIPLLTSPKPMGGTKAYLNSNVLAFIVARVSMDSAAFQEFTGTQEIQQRDQDSWFVRSPGVNGRRQENRIERER